MADRTVAPTVASIFHHKRQTKCVTHKRTVSNKRLSSQAMPSLGAMWCLAVTLVVIAGTTAQARYLPTRARVDGVERLRELLHDVSADSNNYIYIIEILFFFVHI